MPEFNPQTVTAGSAVAQTLQEILARRRAEERQAMADRLGYEEQASVRAAREAQTQLERDQETRMAGLTNAQVKQIGEETYKTRTSRLGRGAAATALPEDLAKQIREHGEFETTNLPDPFGENVSVELFTGSPEQQERARLSGLRDTLANRLRTADPAKDRTGLAADFVEAEMAPPASLVEFQNPTRVLDWRGQQVGTDIPGGFDVQMLQQPYTNYGGGGGAAMGPQWARWIDPDTKQERTGRLTYQEIQNLMNRGVNVQQSFAGDSDFRPNPQVAATLRNRLTEAKANLDARIQQEGERFNWFGLSTPQESPETTFARSEYSMALGQLFGQDPAPYELKDIAAQILSDPELANLPLPDALSEFETEDAAGQVQPLNPQEVEIINRLVTAGRGVLMTPPPAAGAVTPAFPMVQP